MQRTSIGQQHGDFSTHLKSITTSVDPVAVFPPTAHAELAIRIFRHCRSRILLTSISPPWLANCMSRSLLQYWMMTTSCSSLAQTTRVMTLTLSVGTRIPAYLTALGRVMLAELGDEQLESYFARLKIDHLTSHTISDLDSLRGELVKVRKRGYCIIDQEIEEGVRAAAVPVTTNSLPALAISVSAHASRVKLSTLEADYVPKLKSVAEELSSLLAQR